MAVVIDGGGGDRKKPLHAELNLVPYIDLLTCMVAFLLITVKTMDAVMNAGFPAVSLLDAAPG